MATYGTVNADVIQSGTTGLSIGPGNATRFKNRIINGDMRIDQRNSGASVTPTGAQYLVDRWQINTGTSSKFSFQQNAGSVTPPVGFTNYLGCTSLSAYTPSSTDYFQLRQIIEGFNIADLGWGTANAKTVTLSFWVYSSLTGSFGGSIRNNPNFTYCYPFSFTISSANTWTQISITVVGPNASQGSWNTTNSAGLEVVFDLGCGSTYLGTAGAWASGVYAGVTGDTKVVSTNGATFYITGVQLEVASNATGFEYVDYTTQLVMCQRYYAKQTGATGGVYTAFGSGFNTSSSQANYYIKYPVSMRAAATFNYSSLTINSVVSPAVTSISSYNPGTDSALVQLNASGGGLTAGQGTCLIAANTTAAYIEFSAEL